MQYIERRNLPALRKKVMVVEDDREVRHLMELSLGMKLNVRVLVATDGFMALMMARGEMPDLILMDLRMPYVDGFQAIEMLKSDERTSHIPIMAFSNYDWKFGWKEKVTELGCVRCLDKTEFMPQIADIVDEFLETEA
jgi:CheY-like chemotaxis protein